jgi:hypothetical protein
LIRYRAGLSSLALFSCPRPGGREILWRLQESLAG